jgi:hypothetical protein
MFARPFFRRPGLAAVLSGQELEIEEEHVARKAGAFRYYHSEMSHLFDDDLRLSHRIRAFAAGPPRRHRRCVERVWRPT